MTFRIVIFMLILFIDDRQNTKKIRFIIHYVKPTAQLLFKIRFPKGGP